MGTLRLPNGSQFVVPVTHPIRPDARVDRQSRLEDVESRQVSMKLPTPRRDTVARKALRVRILSEFNEMPGMALSATQAARLFDLPQDRCERILNELTEVGLLSLRANGLYGLPLGAVDRKAG